MIRTICPSLAMRMKALGAKALAACASSLANGRCRPSIRPPPAAAACRNERRETPFADDERSAPLAVDVRCSRIILRLPIRSIVRLVWLLRELAHKYRL